MLNPDPNESPSITRVAGHLAGTILRRVGIADLLNETYEAAFLPDPPQPVQRPKSPFETVLETLVQLIPELMKNGTGPIVGTTFPAAPPAPQPPFTKYSDGTPSACAAPCARTCGEDPTDLLGRVASDNARLSSLIDEALKHLGVDPANSCDPDTLRTMLPDAVRKVVEERDAARAAGTPPTA